MEGGFYTAPLLQDLDMWDICTPYWRAWWALNEGRKYAATMGGAFPLGLEYSEVSRYAHDHGMMDRDDPDEFEYFVQLVRRMDREYLSHHAKQHPPPRPQRPQPGAATDE